MAKMTRITYDEAQKYRPFSMYSCNFCAEWLNNRLINEYLSISIKEHNRFVKGFCNQVCMNCWILKNKDKFND